MSLHCCRVSTSRRGRLPCDRCYCFTVLLAFTSCNERVFSSQGNSILCLGILALLEAGFPRCVSRGMSSLREWLLQTHRGCLQAGWLGSPSACIAAQVLCVALWPERGLTCSSWRQVSILFSAVTSLDSISVTVIEMLDIKFMLWSRFELQAWFSKRQESSPGLVPSAVQCIQNIHWVCTHHLSAFLVLLDSLLHSRGWIGADAVVVVWSYW